MVICITIMILGVIGNIMVPIVILKTKDMRNSTNIFLTNLSIADLLVLLICTPTVLVEVNTRPDTWVLGRELCKAVPFIELTVAHASVLTILAISFERYYAICEPLKAGYVCTKARALLICLIAWAIAALFTSPILSIAQYEIEIDVDGSEVAFCLTSVDSIWSSAYFIGSISLFFLIPFLVLLILYTIIAKQLMSNPRLLSHHNGNNGGNTVLKYRKQAIFMLGTVVISFFICLLPFRALTLWIIIVPPEDIISLGVEGYYNLLYFCRIMFYLNSAMNPILYNLMSTKFRDGFLTLLGCSSFAKSKRHFAMSDRKGTFHTTSTNMSSSSGSRKENARANSNSLRTIRNDSITSVEDSNHELSSGFISGHLSEEEIIAESASAMKKDLGSILRNLPQNFDDIQEIDEPENEIDQSNNELMMVRRAYLTPYYIHSTISKYCGENEIANGNINNCNNSSVIIKTCDELPKKINLLGFTIENENDTPKHKKQIDNQIQLSETECSLKSSLTTTTSTECCNNKILLASLKNHKIDNSTASKDSLFSKDILISKESFV